MSQLYSSVTVGLAGARPSINHGRINHLNYTRMDTPRQNYIPISYLFAIVLGLSFWGKGVSDPDLGWHLLGGAWIVTHGTLPSHDFINSFNSEWHDYHWLSQILLYVLYGAGGYDGLRIFFGLTVAYLFKVLLDILYISIGRRKSVLFVEVFFVAAVLLMAHVTSVRPQVLAVLFVAVAVRRLLQAPRAYEVPLLVLLSILLTNIHVYWVFIPLSWGLFRSLPALLRSKGTLSGSLGVLALLCASGLVSPYGVQNYFLVWEYLSMPEQLLNSISEFKNSLAGGVYVSSILLLYLAILARVWNLRRALAKPGHAAGALIAFLLAVRSIKFITIFVLLGFPYVIRNAGVAIRKYAPSMFHRDAAVAKLVIWIVTLLSIWLSITRFPWISPTGDELSSRYPIDGCKVLAHASQLSAERHGHIRVLTHFNHGGWCRWALYLESPNADFRVTTDGRTQHLPVEHFEKGFELYRLKQGWENTLAQWAPDVAVVPKDTALAQGLELLGNWKIFYEDKHFKIFVPG